MVVVDAVEPGYGASGRNGGQVIPGLKLYPEEVRNSLAMKKGMQSLIQPMVRPILCLT